MDAILTGTAQVLKSVGHTQLTTRAIADRAGVSVGSLYQYFASKDALLRALADAQRVSVMTALEASLRETEGQALAARVPVLVRALIAAKTEDPELDARLTLAMLEIDGPCFLTKDTAPFRALVESALVQHRSEITVEDPELTSFVIVRALEGVLSGAATGERRFDDPQLVTALVRLVFGLLRG